MKEVGVARREVKYRPDRCLAHRLMANMAKVLPTDNPGHRDGYLVRSLYFDTVYDADYHDKVDGLEVRHKLRLRIYGPDASTAKLEEKRKQGRDQWKYSVTLPRGDAELMAAGRYAEALGKHRSPFVQSVLRQMTMRGYVPKTIVEFRRLAFTHPANDTRITFDTSLTASESDLDLFSTRLHLRPINCPVILEVKYNRFVLSHIKSVLQLADQVPVSVSKYCLGRQITMTGGM